MSKHKKSSPNFMCLTYFSWYFGYDIFLQLDPYFDDEPDEPKKRVVTPITTLPTYWGERCWSR